MALGSFLNLQLNSWINDFYCKDAQHLKQLYVEMWVSKIRKSLSRCSNQLPFGRKGDCFLSLQVPLKISIPAWKIITVVRIHLNKKSLQRSLYRLKFLRLGFTNSIAFDLTLIFFCLLQKDFLLRCAIGISSSRSLSRLILLIKLMDWSIVYTPE